jgi:SAM-dependent MidA family methyltransferase
MLSVSKKLGRGKVLVIDYCSESTGEIAVTPWREWLRTYKDHGRGEHYLLEPGSQDITTQVMIDQLMEAVPGLSVTKQSDWLQHWGIQDLVSEGEKYWEQHKSSPDISAMKMHSRAFEAQLITDTTGMGAYSVLEMGS